MRVRAEKALTLPVVKAAKIQMAVDLGRDLAAEKVARAQVVVDLDKDLAAEKAALKAALLAVDLVPALNKT